MQIPDAIEYFTSEFGEIIYPDELTTPDLPYIRRAYLADGSWTYAKSWQSWLLQGWTTVLVGLGAYGDSIVYRASS